TLLPKIPIIKILIVPKLTILHFTLLPRPEGVQEFVIMIAGRRQLSNFARSLQNAAVEAR
ncbi:MAG TPA: hypothetical protein VN833_01610, partial [Candidatus Acidoferrales bacterium]|nr:hypothetical protein [Candidatus Acidoferrales bacterium]